MYNIDGMYYETVWHWDILGCFCDLQTLQILEHEQNGDERKTVSHYRRVFCILEHLWIPPASVLFPQPCIPFCGIHNGINHPLWCLRKLCQDPSLDCCGFPVVSLGHGLCNCRSHVIYIIVLLYIHIIIYIYILTYIYTSQLFQLLSQSSS